MSDDLTAIEKRPDSWRLNFPNFGAVYRGPWAKGVIVDIKVQDALSPWAWPCPSPPYNFFGGAGPQPSTLVLSKAKVDLGNDYLPIFFKPKDKCWDEEDDSGNVVMPAITVNKDKLYFEKSWQSFRVGDEVKVLLQAPAGGGAPKPTAILGFVDGVPRIAEDWIKVVGPRFDPATQTFIGTHFWNWQCSNCKIGALDTVIKDPTGLDLKLLKAYGPSRVQSVWDPQPQHPGYYDVYGHWQDDVNYSDGSPVANPWTANGNGWEYNLLTYLGFVDSPPAPSADNWFTHTHDYTENVNITVEFMFIVGLLLYVWQIGYSVSMNKSSTIWLTPTEAAALTSSALAHVIGTEYYNGDAYYMPIGAVGPETPNYSLSSLQPQIGAGVYSQKLWDAILANAIQNPINQYPGVYSQFNNFNMTANPDWSAFQMDWQNATIYVRPHTKAELQAAGLWPWDN